MSEHFSVSKTLTELPHAPGFLLHFVRNPIASMHDLPRWNLLTYMVLQTFAGFTTGVLLGLATRSFWNFLVGSIVLPIAALIITWIIAFYFHSSFSVLQRESVELTRLFKVVSLSALPYFALHVLSGFLPPIDLLGFALTSLLIIVGLSENFRITRKAVIQNTALLYVAFFIVWSVIQMTQTKPNEALKDMTSPQSIEQMEKRLPETL